MVARNGLIGSKKRLWAVLLAMVALLSYASAAAGARVKIGIAWGSGSEQFKASVIERFKAANPDLEVEFTTGAWNDILGKIPVQVAAGTAPDVWYGESGRAMEWGHAGIVEDLQPYVRRDLKESDYYFLLAARDPRGGQVWGIPGGFQMTTMYYNRTLFDEAGLNYPDAQLDGERPGEPRQEIEKAGRRPGYAVWLQPAAGRPGIPPVLRSAQKPAGGFGELRLRWVPG